MRSSYDVLDERTLAAAVQVVEFARRLEAVTVVTWLVKQLVSAATSVAANQRAARRARSNRELVAKLSIVVEEADEVVFWCELLGRISLPPAVIPELTAMAREARELRAVYAKGRATARNRVFSARVVTLLALVVMLRLVF